jgi:hypothetical protein
LPPPELIVVYDEKEFKTAWNLATKRARELVKNK